MFIAVQGKVFQNNIAKVDVIAENITMDVYKSTGGFFYRSVCNLPGLPDTAELVFKNIIAYYSQPKLLIYGFIVNTGGANITIINLDIDVYNSNTSPYLMVGYMMSSNCVPQDDLSQKVEVDGTVWKLSENPTGDRISFIVHNAIIPTPRIHQLIIKNALFTNMTNPQRPFFGSTGLHNYDIVIQNVTAKNINVNEHLLI